MTNPCVGALLAMLAGTTSTFKELSPLDERLGTAVQDGQGTTHRERAPGKGLTGQGRGIAAKRDSTDFSQTVTVCPPWRTVPRSPFPLSGSDTQQRERVRAHRTLSQSRPRPARRRSITDLAATAGLRPLSRAAVTAVTSRGGASPQGAATPRGLTADPAHNRTSSAGQAQACLADTPAAVAVDAPSPASAGATASASRPTDGPAPSPAHASDLATNLRLTSVLVPSPWERDRFSSTTHHYRRGN